MFLKDIFVFTFHLSYLERFPDEYDLRLANGQCFNSLLEFGRDLTFVGDEYAITVGNDTFCIDLLFFHRRLRCIRVSV
jgi:predicted nuclease of restriction endonuclease-like (RecB) superfamily